MALKCLTISASVGEAYSKRSMGAAAIAADLLARKHPAAREMEKRLRATPPTYEGWTLLAANIFWALAYDTEYAMVDRDDDLKIGIRTAAITFGRFDVVAVMLCYVAMLGILTAVGRQQAYGPLYFAGLAAAAALAAYHYTLIRERRRDGCFAAFRHNNWFGAAIFAGIVAEFNLWPGLAQ